MSAALPSGRVGRTVFVYWGRRGALSLLTLRLTEVLTRRPDLDGLISYSAENEIADALGEAGVVSSPFHTFRHGRGAALGLPGFIVRARRLIKAWQANDVGSIVILMPHVWTPVLTRMAHRAGLAAVVVVHDAQRHPGDRTGVVQGWLMSDLRHVDRIVTLSQAVTDQLVARHPSARARITTLFHPHVAPSLDSISKTSLADRPLHVLWFGRVMRYKGVSMLLDAIEALRRDGIVVQLTVAGEGNLSKFNEALARVSATVVNRWLTNTEIAAFLEQSDVVALPYFEASQSGVVAAAFGAGRPVVVTPVGGLAEQVEHGINGLISERADALALAATLRTLALDRDLLETIRQGAKIASRTRSVESFAEALTDIARNAASPRRN